MEPLSLENVAAPAHVPDDIPDDKASQELAYVKGLCELSPTGRQLHAQERQLSHFDGERKRLLSENARLQSQLDRLRPAHAALRESHRNTAANGTTAAVSGTIGSALLGMGGYWPEVADIRLVFLGGGSIATGLAIWMSIKGCIWLWPEKQSGSTSDDAK